MSHRIKASCIKASMGINGRAFPHIAIKRGAMARSGTRRSSGGYAKSFEAATYVAASLHPDENEFFITSIMFGYMV